MEDRAALVMGPSYWDDGNRVTIDIDVHLHLRWGSCSALLISRWSLSSPSHRDWPLCIYTVEGHQIIHNCRQFLGDFPYLISPLSARPGGTSGVLFSCTYDIQSLPVLIVTFYNISSPGNQERLLLNLSGIDNHTDGH